MPSSNNTSGSQSCGLSATRGDVIICLDTGYNSHYSWDQAFFKYDLEHSSDLLDSDVRELISDFNTGNLTSIDCGRCYEIYSHLDEPQWFLNDLKMWANSDISDNDLASAMQYLYNGKLFSFSDSP